MNRFAFRTTALAACLALMASATGCSDSSDTDGDLFFAPKPVVTTVNPSSGPQTGGTTVTISGDAFDANVTVLIDGQAAFSVSVIDSQTITAITPLSSNPGAAVDVVVRNPLTSGALTGGFTYDAVAPSPDTGGVAGGDTVTIAGAGFLASTANTVSFGAAAGTNVQVIDDNTLTVVTPAQPSGTVDVTVNTDFGTAVLPDAFTFAVMITDMTPNVASSDGGTIIRITTSGFPDDFTMDTPSVTFGGTPSPTVTALDAVTVTAEVPAGLLEGQTTVAVAGLSESASSTDFTIVAPVAAGDVIVNEVLLDPGTSGSHVDANRDGDVTDDTDDEYVEIVNVRNTPVDLSGYTISDAVSGIGHVFPNPTTLPAGGAIVVFGGGDLTQSNPAFAPLHGSGAAQVASTGSLNLNDAGDTVTLADPLTNAIDSFAATGTAGESQNRDPDGTAGGAIVNHGAVTTPPAAVDPTTGAPISPGVRADQSGF